MFFGCFEHNLDEKGRLMIPSKMRDDCGSKVFMLKGFDGSIAVYKESEFEKLVTESTLLPFNSKANRDYLRARLGTACELGIDKVGRVQIPTLVLNKYGIGKSVVVIGVGDHFEIWDKEAYTRYENEVNENFEAIAEGITLKNE